MMKQYIAKNQNNIQSFNFIHHQTISNLGNNHPILFQLQNQDQSPSTPGAHGSSNRSKFDEIFPTQQLADDEVENEVTKGKGRGKGKGKGKEKEKKKVNRDRWSCEEDLCVVSAVLNCGGDIVVGTNITEEFSSS